jgi:hypothetical protein
MDWLIWVLNPRRCKMFTSSPSSPLCLPKAFTWGWSCRVLRLTTNLLIVLTLRRSGATLQFPLCDFIGCIGKNLPFIFTFTLWNNQNKGRERENNVAEMSGNWNTLIFMGMPIQLCQENHKMVSQHCESCIESEGYHLEQFFKCVH